MNKYFSETAFGKKIKAKVIDYGKTLTANGIEYEDVEDKIVGYAHAIDPVHDRDTLQEVIRHWYDGI